MKQRNKEKSRLSSNKYRKTEKGKIQTLIDGARRRSKKNGASFDLKKEDIVIPEFCPVLGIPLRLDAVSTGKLNPPDSPTLDRIDNNKGYYKENVVVVSWRANRLKADATLIELEQLWEFYRKYKDGGTK